MGLSSASPPTPLGCLQAGCATLEGKADFMAAWGRIRGEPSAARVSPSVSHTHATLCARHLCLSTLLSYTLTHTHTCTYTCSLTVHTHTHLPIQTYIPLLYNKKLNTVYVRRGCKHRKDKCTQHSCFHPLAKPFFEHNYLLFLFIVTAWEKVTLYSFPECLAHIPLLLQHVISGQMFRNKSCFLHHSN